uniref:Galectin n=1 Tax=Echeneis naucrates TaxID=173247 RepID=A0A665UJK4_ECHNA
MQLSDALSDWPSQGNQSGGGGPWPGQTNNPTWPGTPTNFLITVWRVIHRQTPFQIQVYQLLFSGGQSVPYSQNLPRGIFDKLLITITGTIKPNADKITLDLSTANDIAFHFNPRFNESGSKVIVRNSRVGKKWGKEERALQHFPFVQGQPFEIKILCTNREFKVAVNNSHLLEFKHRITDLISINRLNIHNDLSLSKVHMETLL